MNIFNNLYKVAFPVFRDQCVFQTPIKPSSKFSEAAQSALQELPPSSASSPSPSFGSAIVLKDQWTQAITPTAKEVLGLELPLEANIQKPSERKNVGWDQYKITTANTESSSLYTKQVGPCVAVLARVINSNFKSPSNFGLSHCWGSAQAGIDMIDELKNSGNQGDVLQIFVTGGFCQNHTSMNVQKRLLSHINELVSSHSGIELIDDKRNIGGNREEVSVGLSEVGFDQEGNPYLVIDTMRI